MHRITIVLITLLGFCLAQEFEYVGTKSCKTCHNKSKTGAQYKVWEQTAHAQAFETLKSEVALELARKAGVEGNPWEAPECLRCHTTGFGAGGYEVKDEAFWNPDPEDRVAKKAVKRMAGLQSVGCEACHGPGSAYKKKKVMEAIFNGETDAASVGLIVPNEETCLTCHNEDSPSYKPFDFEERVKEIAHPYPEGMRP
jgi:formate-dependent nitrite reductase cytochrome c552 subunit